MALSFTAGSGSGSSGTFTFDDGTVQRVTSRVVANIEQEALAGSSASSAFLFDFEGVIKQIRIEGRFYLSSSTRVSGQSITTIANKIDWWEALLNGNQTVHTFTSNYNSANPCMIADFQHDEEGGNPLLVPFILTLYVGTQ